MTLDRRLTIRATTHEKQLIVAAASVCGLTVSEFIRRAALRAALLVWPEETR